MDSCGDMLMATLKNLDFDFRFMDYMRADILSTSLLKTDIIITHGVLEHFSDEQVRHIVDRQSRESRIAMHYVPTNAYDNPSFGDERLLSVEQWCNLVNPDRITLFNNDHDLILVKKGIP
jgi:hypothetical protein